MTRTAISPRFAIRIFFSTAANVGAVLPDGGIHSWQVTHVAETGSTNTDLIDAAQRGEVHDRIALVTDHQTAGRGRLDRRWIAPAGSNLLVSLLFGDVPEHPARLTQRVGLAAVAAVESLTEPEPSADLGLKWPNDVMYGTRKLAGILAQRSSSTGVVVVGIGLNVGWAPDGAASLADDLGSSATRRELLTRLLVELDRQDSLDDHVLVDAYRNRLVTIGQTVRIDRAGGDDLVGDATDVDESGRLVVLDGSGRRHLLDAGDVVHLRPLPGPATDRRA